MKINRKLWWIPIIGMIHIVKIGFKNGFFEEIENLKGDEALTGSAIHAVSFVLLFLGLLVFLV